MSSLKDDPNSAKRLSGLTAAAARAWLALRYRVLSRRHRRLVMEAADGLDFVVLPDVFNPVLFRIGPFFARTAEKIIDAAHRSPASRSPLAVLDLGTGSGIVAAFAARAGARVMATDINPEAVRCAKLNFLLNKLEDRAEARCGDLFEPVRGKLFDLVLFSPPFYRGRPASALDHAWRSENIFERFTAGLSTALKPGGKALVAVSTDGAGWQLLDLLCSAGFGVETVNRAHWGNEIAVIYAVTPRAARAKALQFREERPRHL